MAITFELNTPFFTWGETIKGRYRVKMGSNESIWKNLGGYAKLREGTGKETRGDA